MKRLLTLFFSPLTFALGFLAPVIAQSAEALGWGVPGLANLTLGLALALALGYSPLGAARKFQAVTCPRRRSREVPAGQKGFHGAC